MTTATQSPPSARTEHTRRAYDRASRWYDLQEWLPERLAFRKWRRQLWDMVPDGRVLEVGVGTGKNLRYYRDGHGVTAIDLSPKMIERANKNAKRWRVEASLLLMDAQALEFEDSAFDSAVSTFVFCSVPDPVQGLREVSRILRPGGRVYLLEHVLSRKQPMRWAMQRLNGLVSNMGGANINRDTVANVEAAGFAMAEVQDLWSDVVKLIVAEKAV
jgi:phosphatidylethanolamine/phosphatidyl-N-methylethanolamine N-methyltransferase